MHELKTWPEDFEAIAAGRKTHEARKNDRDFAVGDRLRLREWKPDAPERCDWSAAPGSLTGDYTGRTLDVEVTHITRGAYGLPPDLAVMSIRLVVPPSALGEPRGHVVRWTDAGGQEAHTRCDTPEGALMFLAERRSWGLIAPRIFAVAEDGTETALPSYAEALAEVRQLCEEVNLARGRTMEALKQRDEALAEIERLRAERVALGKAWARFVVAQALGGKEQAVVTLRALGVDVNAMLAEAAS